jgi:hypothetical protein
MCEFTTLEDFIVRIGVHKYLIVVLHIAQVTQAMSLLETKPKIVFDISCDHLAPSMAIILSIHALHLRRPMNSWKHGWQFKKGHFHRK